VKTAKNSLVPDLHRNDRFYCRIPDSDATVIMIWILNTFSSRDLETFSLPAHVLYCMLCCVEGYGQTESTLLCGTFKKMNKWVKPGSIGKAAPGYDVRIVNNMGKEVPRGEQAGGQLAFKKRLFFNLEPALRNRRKEP